MSETTEQISQDLILKSNFSSVRIIDTVTNNCVICFSLNEFEGLFSAIKKFKHKASRRKYTHSEKGRKAAHEVYIRRKIKGLTQTSMVNNTP